MTDTKHSAELATCDFCRAEAPVRRKYLYRENKEREIGDGFTITRYCHECGLKSENTDTKHTDSVESLAKELRMVANMINMGEKIQWGRETTLMDKVADMLTTLKATQSQQVAEAYTKGRSDEAKTCTGCQGRCEQQVEEAVRRFSPWLQHDATCFLYIEEGMPEQCDCGLTKALTPNHQD